MLEARALTFDVGGTLDGPGIPWRPRLEPWYRAEGIVDSPEQLARAFYDADDHLHERHSLAGLDLRATLELQVADTLSNLGRRDARLVERIADRFVREARASFAATRPLLERLARAMPLGIISNFYGNLRDVLRHEGLLELFQVVIDSREVGFEKPDRRIFLAATSALGVAPAKVAHVGDSLPRDVKGARAAGLIPVWYAPQGGDDEGAETALRIRELGELETLLAEAHRV